MLTYEKLSTEKYWHDSIKAELKSYRREKNRDAMRSLLHFGFAVGVIFLVVFAYQTMPTWLPVATDYLTYELQNVNSFMESQKIITNS